VPVRALDAEMHAVSFRSVILYRLLLVASV
jgi:hypothetical protein